jgi:hypothetical protein
MWVNYYTGYDDYTGSMICKIVDKGDFYILQNGEYRASPYNLSPRKTYTLTEYN